MNRTIRKLTREDKFARKYYCKHARLNSVRADKKRNKKILRKWEVEDGMEKV